MTDTTLRTAAAADLKSYLERIERLEEERKSLSDDVRSIYADAKANGFDPKAIRKMVKRRREDPNEAQRNDAILESYMHAVGMLPENPLAAAISALAQDAMAREQVIEAFKTLTPMHGEIIAKVGGAPMRIWRDEAGAAHAEDYVAPKAKPAEKAGRGLRQPAAILTMVPKDPVQAAADRAERRSGKPPAEAPSDSDQTEPVE